MGIPYPYIVEELADLLGGTPEHGNRNSFIFTMACHLRHVCNNDPQWIRSVLPNYGEAQDRVNATIESACRRNQSQITPLKVKTALTLARKRVNLEKGTDEASLMRQPMMPERLPAPVRLIVSKAPHGYWPAIANTTFGAFATYTGGVKAEFWNNTAMEMNQLHLLVAPMSIGKSSIKEPINHILQPIIERDKQARQREKEWAEETNTKGANKEKPERPKDICVQVVDSDMTNAAFCQRMEDAERAGNKALFTRMDEFEQLKKLAGGSMSEVVEMALPVGADLTLTYAVNSDGRIKVDMDYQPKAADIPLIPKFGMRMRLPADFKQIKYYGRGPWENYPDRKRSAFLGIYEMPLSDYETEYVRPQDNGNRCDIRWFEISSPEQKLRIEGNDPLCIRAWDYGEEDLNVRHPNEINRGRFVNLNIDLNIHGVGGVDTWGQRTLPQYTIDGNKPYHYSFILM